MGRKLALLVTLFIIAVSLLACGEQEKARRAKDVQSAEFGLHRNLKVYSQSGELLREYEGVFDIDSNKDIDGGTTGTKIKFDLNGKRVIIYNAIVITEELDEKR